MDFGSTYFCGPAIDLSEILSLYFEQESFYMSRIVLIVAEKAFFTLTDALTKELESSGIEIKQAASLDQTADYLERYAPEFIAAEKEVIAGFQVKFSQLIEKYPNTKLLEMPSQIENLPNSLNARQSELLSLFLTTAYIFPKIEFSRENPSRRRWAAVKEVFSALVEHQKSSLKRVVIRGGGKRNVGGRSLAVAAKVTAGAPLEQKLVSDAHKASETKTGIPEEDPLNNDPTKNDEDSALILEKKDRIVVACTFAVACLILIAVSILPAKFLMDYWFVFGGMVLSVPIGRFAARAYLKQQHR